MDLLRRLTNGNGAWCATVASECARSAQQPGLHALDEAPRIFGEPLLPNPAELVDTQTLRLELAQPGDRRHAHLGEAETLAIMTRRQLNGFFVTDDHGAARLAANHGVNVASTWTLIRMAVRAGFIDDATAWGYTLSLRAKGRGCPVGVNDRASFDMWLGLSPPSR